MAKTSEIQSLKLIYSDIVQGCSYIADGNFHIKHLCELDNIYILKKQQEFFQQYVKANIPTEKEQLQSCYEQEIWSPQKEEEILGLRYRITDNEKMLPSIIPQQQEKIKTIIVQDKVSLAHLLQDRREIFNLTADNASEKDGFRFFVYYSLFKDAQCKIPLFDSWDDFELEDEDALEKYIIAIEENSQRFSEINIKSISVLSFFLNSFSFAKENVSIFWGKPICQLTNYQLLLTSLGSRNINILNQAAGHPPDLMEDIPVETVINWFDQNYSIILGKRDSNN